MNLAIYRERLQLQEADFCHIDHEEAMVAVVYKVTTPGKKPCILKICARGADFAHEQFFLTKLAKAVVVPRLIDVVVPEKELHGAILMECLEGGLLNELTDALAFEIGKTLASIHQHRVAGFGDLIEPEALRPDPIKHFTLKFEEGLDECTNHLPHTMIDQCRRFFEEHLVLLQQVDGPCIVHRDFRPGNIMVKEGKLQGIIDWSSGRASFAEEDFCPLEHDEWLLEPSQKAAFLAGYATLRPVPGYSELMPLLRLNKAIATVGFLVKRGTWQNRHKQVYERNRQFLDTLFTLPSTPNQKL